MNALAVIFRLLGLLSLAGLAGILWLKWQEDRQKSNSFLDEVVSTAYDILQSERETQWKDVDTKERRFCRNF